MSPNNQVQRFCLDMNVPKEKEEVIAVNHGDGGSEWSPSPTASRLVTPRDLSLDAVLFTQCVLLKLLEGKLGK